MKRGVSHREKHHKEESMTWMILVVLVIVFFLFQWNFIYSIIGNACSSYQDYWLTESVFGHTVFGLTRTIFVLVGALSLLELVKGIAKHVDDRLVAISVNFFICVCVLACLYVQSKQAEFISLKISQETYSDIYPKMHISDFGAYHLFYKYRQYKYCSGEIQSSYPSTREEYDTLWKEFSQSGWVRAGMK